MQGLAWLCRVRASAVQVQVKTRRYTARFPSQINPVCCCCCAGADASLGCSSTSFTLRRSRLLRKPQLEPRFSSHLHPPLLSSPPHPLAHSPTLPCTVTSQPVSHAARGPLPLPTTAARYPLPATRPRCPLTQPFDRPRLRIFSHT